ncbi:hypothetical protein B0H66DRAFT_44550 [Apodospora peruviana]|uniref:Uncharacterized protein n=1 Tax=Apodospora peruviana TaxID=516989 RepID=A0AAE0IRQ2_9PEZI|nr:hypothetical protein B0H66DRAFT_44550 [Apodospora peruviana]
MPGSRPFRSVPPPCGTDLQDSCLGAVKKPVGCQARTSLTRSSASCQLSKHSSHGKRIDLTKNSKIPKVPPCNAKKIQVSRYEIRTLPTIEIVGISPTPPCPGLSFLPPSSSCRQRESPLNDISAKLGCRAEPATELWSYDGRTGSAGQLGKEDWGCNQIGKEKRGWVHDMMIPYLSHIGGLLSAESPGGLPGRRYAKKFLGNTEAKKTSTGPGRRSHARIRNLPPLGSWSLPTTPDYSHRRDCT